MPHDLLGELIRTAHLAERRLGQVVEGAGLTPAQFAVLSCLEDMGDLSHSELARALRVRRQGISRLLGEMVEIGLIERIGLGGRGRRNGQRITEAGVSALDRARPAVVRASRPSAMGLTAPERDELARLLVQVRDRLDDEELA
ncbi:MAG TPA: MarR family transcriptional regulator [Kribbella sp.]